MYGTYIVKYTIISYLNIGIDDYNLRMGKHWIDTKQLIIDSE